MARGISLTPNTNFVGSNFWSVNTYLMSLNLRKVEIGELLCSYLIYLMFIARENCLFQILELRSHTNIHKLPILKVTENLKKY